MEILKLELKLELEPEPKLLSKCEPLPRALKQFKFVGNLLSGYSLQGVSIMEFECTSSGSRCDGSMLTLLMTRLHFGKFQKTKEHQFIGLPRN